MVVFLHFVLLGAGKFSRATFVSYQRFIKGIAKATWFICTNTSFAKTWVIRVSRNKYWNEEMEKIFEFILQACLDMLTFNMEGHTSK